MSEHKFYCPACEQKIACDSSAAGKTISCPTCQVVFAVPMFNATTTPPPVPAPAAPPVAAPAMRPPAPRALEIPPELRAKPYGAVTQVGKNYCGLAIASLLSSMVLFVGWLPGIICGHMAKNRMRRDPLLDGEKMATAGLVISYLTLSLILLASTGFAFLNHHWAPTVQLRDTPAAQYDLDRRIVDQIDVGDSTSEAQHGLQGNFGSTQRPTGYDGTNRWRGAEYGDIFAYSMKVLPDHAMTVNCRYSDSPNQRSFNIAVNDQLVGGEVFKFNVPGHFYDVEYKIPESVTRGKDRVTVEFQSQDVGVMSKLYGCQMLKP